MSSVSAWVVVGALSMAQAPPLAGPTTEAPAVAVDPAPARAAEIKQAIVELGSDEFIKRQAATRALLAIGLEAKPALEAASNSADQEIRQRAAQILNDFAYGILPGMDRIVAERIRQFRDGDAAESNAAFQWLIERLQTPQFISLLTLRSAANRSVLLRSMLANDSIVEQYDSPADVSALIDQIGKDLEPTWRVQNLSTSLFSTKLLNHWMMTDQLDALVKMAGSQPDASRTDFLYGLFQSSASLQSLLENGHFPFIMKLVELIPDDAGRTRLLTRLTYDSKSITLMVKEGHWETLFSYIEKSKDEPSLQRMLESLFRNTTAMTHLLETEGMEHLIGLTKRAKTATIRGRLLASLLANSTIQKHLAKEGNTTLALTAAQNEKDEAARREYLKVLLQSIRYRNDVPPTLVKALWDLVKADKDVDWQLETMAYMIQSNLGAELLKSDEEMAWIIDLISKAKDKNTGNVLRYLIQNSNNLRQVLRYGHFETVWKLVQQTDDNLISSLFASSELTKQLSSAKQLDRLVEIPKNENDLAVREKLLSAIFRNYSAIPKLIADGHYESFEAMIGELPQPAQAKLFGVFLRGSGVTQHLIEKKNIQPLWRFAKDDTAPEVRQAFLQELFTNIAAMNELLKGDGFEKLYGFAKGEKDDSQRLRLLTSFFQNSSVASRFVKQGDAGELLDFAGKLDPNLQRTYLQRLFANEPVMQALIKANRFRDVLGYIRGTTERYRRASLFGSLISNSESLKKLIKSDSFGELIDLAANDPDSYARRQMIYYLVGRSNNLPVLVRSNHFDRVLQLIQVQEGRTRSEMLVRMLSDSSALEYLVTSKRLRKVIDSGVNDPTPDGRDYFISRLFSNTSSLDGMVKAGYFGELEGLATSAVTDVNKRAQYQGNLYTTNSALQELIEQQRVRLLFELIINQPTEKLGSTVYQRVVSNQRAVAALIEQGSFDELIQISIAPHDPAERGRRAVALLLSSAVMKRLETDEKQITSLVRSVLSHDDASVRVQFLSSLAGQPALIKSVMSLGFYDEVLAMMDQEKSKSRQTTVLGRFLASPLVLEAKKGEPLERVFQLLEDEANSYSRNSIISSLSQGIGFKWVVKLDRVDDLLKQIEREPNTSSRGYMYRTMLLSDDSLKCLVDAKKTQLIVDVIKRVDDEGLNQQFVSTLTQGTAQQYLDEKLLVQHLFEVLGEMPEANRTSYVQNMVTSAKSRDRFITSGQTDLLRKAIKWLPADQQATQMDHLLFAPSGLVSHLIKSGKLSEAASEAEAHIEDDLGMIRFAAYLAAQGNANERIESLSQVPSDQRTEKQSRLLVYLLRANGSLSAAIDVAKDLQAPGLVKTLAVEHRDWTLAAKLQAEDPCVPPCPIPGAASLTEKYGNIEQLGLLASYQRLARQDDAAEKTLRKIRQLHLDAPEDNALAWHCAQAMLLNDDVAGGLNILSQGHQRRLFELFVYRQEYAKALETIKFDWKEFEEELTDNTSQRMDNFNFALQIASMLHATGQSQELAELYDGLESFSDSVGRSSYPTSSTLLMSLASHHFRRGNYKATWRLVDKCLAEGNYGSSLLSRLFSSTSDPTRNQAAMAWWKYLSHKEPNAAIKTQIQRIERILSPAADGDEQWFQPLVDGAMEHASELTGATKEFFALGVGITCVQREYFEAAESSLKLAGANGRFHLAKMLAKQEKWESAAELFQQVDEENQLLISLFMAGDCLEKAGKADEGKALKDRANLLALSSRTRHDFAKMLLTHGFMEDGIQQMQLVRRTAPPEHWEHNDAARYLGIHSPDDFARSAEYWQVYMLGNLRPNFFFNNTVSYLSIPHLIHKLRAKAAIEAGDDQAAMQEIQRCQQAAMSPTSLVEELTPMLLERKQGDASQALFTPHFEHYAKLVEQYPESALLHNNLAWLCARANQQLKLALTHADKAVSLSPNNAGHLDTLAEVHFRLGNVDKAIETERKAIQLDPKKEFKEQLERFSQGSR